MSDRITKPKNNYTWPFKWTAKTKHVRNKMQFWCETVRDTKQPITLTKVDYDALMQTLPHDFIKIGKPMWDGREIKRMGEK